MLIAAAVIRFALFTLVGAVIPCPSAEELTSWWKLDVQFVRDTVFRKRGETWKVPFGALEVTPLNGGHPVEDMCLYSARNAEARFAVKIIPGEARERSACDKGAGVLLAEGVVNDATTRSNRRAYIIHEFTKSDDIDHWRYTSLPEWKDTCGKVNEGGPSGRWNDRDASPVADVRGFFNHKGACEDLVNRLGEAIMTDLKRTALTLGLLNTSIDLKHVLFRKNQVLPSGFVTYSVLYVGAWDSYVKIPIARHPDGILSHFYGWATDSALDGVLRPAGQQLPRFHLGKNKAHMLLNAVSSIPEAKICVEGDVKWPPSAL